MPSIEVGLPLREAVYLIVVDEYLEVYVPPEGVYEVVAALSVAVPVSGGYDDREVMIGELRAGGHGNSASVEAVKEVAPDIVRQLCRLSYARDQEQLVRM
jgi:hypothetical protein